MLKWQVEAPLAQVGPLPSLADLRCIETHRMKVSIITVMEGKRSEEDI